MLVRQLSSATQQRKTHVVVFGLPEHETDDAAE